MKTCFINSTYWSGNLTHIVTVRWCALSLHLFLSTKPFTPCISFNVWYSLYIHVWTILSIFPSPLHHPQFSNIFILLNQCSRQAWALLLCLFPYLGWSKVCFLFIEQFCSIHHSYFKFLQEKMIIKLSMFYSG